MIASAASATSCWPRARSGAGSARGLVSAPGVVLGPSHLSVFRSVGSRALCRCCCPCPRRRPRSRWAPPFVCLSRGRPAVRRASLPFAVRARPQGVAAVGPTASGSLFVGVFCARCLAVGVCAVARSLGPCLSCSGPSAGSAHLVLLVVVALPVRCPPLLAPGPASLGRGPAVRSGRCGLLGRVTRAGAVGTCAVPVSVFVFASLPSPPAGDRRGLRCQAFRAARVLALSRPLPRLVPARRGCFGDVGAAAGPLPSLSPVARSSRSPLPRSFGSCPPRPVAALAASAQVAHRPPRHGRVSLVGPCRTVTAGAARPAVLLGPCWPSAGRCPVAGPRFRPALVGPPSRLSARPVGCRPLRPVRVVRAFLLRLGLRGLGS